MKEFWLMIQAVFTGLGGWMGYYLGGCDGLLYALIAFVIVDYLTGVMCAIADKKLSSEVGFKGICRKVLIFLLVGIANIIDIQVIELEGDIHGLSDGELDIYGLRIDAMIGAFRLCVVIEEDTQSVVVGLRTVVSQRHLTGEPLASNLPDAPIGLACTVDHHLVDGDLHIRHTHLSHFDGERVELRVTVFRAAAHHEVERTAALGRVFERDFARSSGIEVRTTSRQ